MNAGNRSIVKVVAAIIGVGMLAGCMSPMDGGLSDHPLPTTASIIPLQIGNQWIFRYTVFDSTGTMAPFPDRDLNLAITGAYYQNDSGNLVPLGRGDGVVDANTRILYRYEWESLDKGYLVYHQGTGAAALRGLYIAGTFVGTNTVLFDTARHWYAYPGEPGVSLQIDLPDDDTAVSVVECIGVAYPAWFIQTKADSPHPVHFLDSCYLYRQTVGNHVFYHTFHPDFGEIGMRHYYSGILQECYVLVSVNLILDW